MTQAAMLTSVDPALVLTGITKTYPGVRALDGVSVSAHPGRVHAILGENGAGKSTLVGIAAGSVVPDSGTIGLGGAEFSRIQTREARERGLAIVYQTPALAPALSVLDAVLLLVPQEIRPARREAAAWLNQHFARLGLDFDPATLVSRLSPREAHLIEFAAALAADPQVLVLDEPTEALGAEETRWLFGQIADLLAKGVAIVYITHRIPEVIEIATELTVLRDGRVVGHGQVSDFTADEIVELIIGRSLETTFPPKAESSVDDAPVLEVRGLSGAGFADVSFAVHPGEIVGLAGVEGNGQRELMRALAGGGASSGTVLVGGREISVRSSRATRRAGIAFLPGDRLGEAMFGKMSIRENVVAPSMGVVMPTGVVNRPREYRFTSEAIAGLAVKTPTLETPVASLSGGSQQKVLLARARIGEPRVVLVEDPTQGVDAGARVEIYAFLREMARSGVAVVVLSTDAVEIEGLCDRVAVFSRGRVQALLTGDQVTERSVTGAAVMSTGHADSVIGTRAAKRSRSRLPFGLGNELNAGMLLVLTLALAVFTTTKDSAFLSPLNTSQLLAASSVLVLAGLAQLLVVMTGGIDLSLGSVVALSGVVVSFFGQAGPAYFGLGVLLALGSGLVVGLVNGILVTRLGLPPVIATLVTSIAVVGTAQVLRPYPGGDSTPDIMTAIGTAIGGIPLVLMGAVGIAVALWFVVARTALGRSFRAAGSNPVQANRMGVSVPTMRLLAATAAGVLAAMAGLALYSRTGIGDANTGQALTLTSVTAIVIAGASIFGGSGSALAVAAAGILLQTITNSIAFLNLGLAWQFWLQGLFVLVAAILPMLARLRTRSPRLAALPGARRGDTPAVAGD
ncbi:MAG: ATP-binding cassette domain-containing protein [Nocardioidaceae bacterium]